MQKLGLGSLIGSLALVSSCAAAEIDLISNLKVSGDARLRVNLDTQTDDGIKLHTRILFNNNNWGDNSDDNFSWDEATFLLPVDNFF